MKRAESGFSLVEMLVSIVILAIIMGGLIPSFIAYMDVNTRNEARTGALQAAQQIMESHRLVQPSSMPNSGSSTPVSVEVDGRTFEVVTRYCDVVQFCGTSSRHLVVEVRLDMDLIYETETVYTELR